MEKIEKTDPKPRGVGPDTDPSLLAHGRYGTDDMIDTWGDEKTFQFSLDAQAAATQTLSDLYPDIIPPEDATELVTAANLDVIDPQKIRELEAAGEHDVVAINSAWAEKVSPKAAAHINKLRASADTTETAKALQLKKSIEIIVDSLENLRDITLEKARGWIDPLHMDQTHLYDALPTVAGRPFAFFVEMLQSDLNFLAFVYRNSIVGKWGDATGNHHSAVTMGIDGMELQMKYCKKLGLGYMTAAAQIPGREFLADVMYALARSSITLYNLADYICKGRGDDVGIFRFPRKQVGSSSMPHKSLKGGNPTAEEQAKSFFNYMLGDAVTGLAAGTFDYARDLSGSASDRINFDDAFKFGDHVTRRLAGVVYKLELDEERSRERVDRTYGTVTSEQLMTYLTDQRRTNSPMTRDEAHELAARLATQAYDDRRPFVDVVMACDEVTQRLSSEVIRDITDPYAYIGQSRGIIRDVFGKYHRRKTLDK